MSEFISRDTKAEVPGQIGGKPSPSRFLSAADLLAICSIFIAVLAVYWPVRSYGHVDLDDPQYVFINPHVLAGLNWQTFKWAFASQTGGLWQPLTMLSFLVDVRLHGPAPGPMHLENVILHAFSAIGWYVLFRCMTGRKGPAFFTAGLFALHPARVESVAWITERKDVLSMLMLVLSLIAYWRYTRRSGPGAYAASLILFALGLMSKAMVVSQPLLILLLDAWPLGRTRWCKPAKTDLQPTGSITIRRLLLEKIPFITLSALESLIALRTQASVGARPDLQRLPIGDRLATAIVGYVRYLGTVFWPRHLAVYYPYQMNLPLGVVVAATALLLILTAVMIRFGRSRPYLLTGWIWFIVAMVPVSGLFQAGDQSMADRFTYLPSVGLTFAAVWFLADVVRRHRQRCFRYFAAICGAAALAVCAILSRQYLSCWVDTISLFTKAAQANGQPDANIELHLGDAYTTARQPDLAVDHYGLSLQLNPSNASVQINLANLLMQYSPEMALPHYQTAIQLKPSNATAHYNYAVCLKALKRDAEADVEFDRANHLKAAE